jgi:hypothetical protein
MSPPRGTAILLRRADERKLSDIEFFTLRS